MNPELSSTSHHGGRVEPPRLRLVVMSDQPSSRRRPMTPRERHLLAAGYGPVIVIAAARIASRIRQWRRQRQKASTT